MLQRLLKLAVLVAPITVTACATSGSPGSSGGGGNAAAGMVAPPPNARYSFIPDWTFQGSSLDG
jgi:hypothetical protein